jgi:hypothetical protein
MGVRKAAAAAVGAFGLILAASLGSTPAARADGSGWLTVTCTPAADLQIDGKDVGMTPVTRYPVSADHHDLVFTIAGQRPHKMGIRVAEGEEKQLNVNF